MGTRARSSVGVVLVGLLPLLAGGPIFAIVLVALSSLAFGEYLALTARLSPAPMTRVAGPIAIGMLAAAALRDGGAPWAVGILAIATWSPVIAGMRSAVAANGAGVVGWALATTGIVYLGLPVYAGVATRRAAGTIDTGWLTSLARLTSPGWNDSPRGLAWLLIILLAAWIGDTFAYIVGRTWGRQKLAPHISPAKTVEGSAGGLVGSAAIGAIGMALFGLGISTVAGLGFGLVLGVVGQTGDLAESWLKRQVGAKDSGNLIPGHGGVLDRIDTLLFTLPTGWLLSLAVDRWLA
jgi:phosphatidate cytidylyltransferase